MSLDRQEAMRRLLVAVARCVGIGASFTASDVWAWVDDDAFRRQCEPERLIAQAFRIARKRGLCSPRPTTAPGAVRQGDEQCHGRPQRVWDVPGGGRGEHQCLSF